MNWLKNVLFLMILGLMILISCKKTTEKQKTVRHEWIAKIDTFDVWASKVDHAFEYSKDFRNAKTITPELLKNYIQHYFLDELYILAEARAMGLDKEPEFQK